MASVEKRTRTTSKQQPDGTEKIITTVSWLARWRGPDGRQHKKNFAKQSDAKRHTAAMAADTARGVYVNTDDKTSVSGAATAWLARRSVRAGTRRRLQSIIDTHITGTPIGSRRLVAVRPSETQQWAAELGKLLAPATVRKVVGVLKSVFEDAVLDHVVATNPVTRISLPSAVRKKIVPLTVAQVLALAGAMAPRYQAMVIVQAGLGLRIGELLGLRVGDVDFLRRVVHIEHQSDTKTREITVLKTESSRRTIPLPLWVADALAAHLAEFPAGHDVKCTCQAGCSRASSPLVFRTAAGTALDQDYYRRRVFGKAVAAAGLPASTTSHDLRHHFASVLLQAGESVVAVAEWLGHDNATLILTVYGHLMPHSEDRMRRAIDNAYAVGADSCAPTVPQRSVIKL
jgi:integrase